MNKENLCAAGYPLQRGKDCQACGASEREECRFLPLEQALSRPRDPCECVRCGGFISEGAAMGGHTLCWRCGDGR